MAHPAVMFRASFFDKVSSYNALYVKTKIQNYGFEHSRLDVGLLTLKILFSHFGCPKICIDAEGVQSLLLKF